MMSSIHVLFVYTVTCYDRWRTLSVHVTITERGDDVESLSKDLKSFLYELRIPADVAVVTMVSDSKAYITVIWLVSLSITAFQSLYIIMCM